MATMDPQYDEVRGNPALPQCLVSFARDEDFFLATKDVLGWSDPVGGAANYAVIPSDWVPLSASVLSPLPCLVSILLRALDKGSDLYAHPSRPPLARAEGGWPHAY